MKGNDEHGFLYRFADESTSAFQELPNYVRSVGSSVFGDNKNYVLDHSDGFGIWRDEAVSTHDSGWDSFLEASQNYLVEQGAFVDLLFTAIDTVTLGASESAHIMAKTASRKAFSTTKPKPIQSPSPTD